MEKLIKLIRNIISEVLDRTKFGQMVPNFSSKYIFVIHGKNNDKVGEIAPMTQDEARHIKNRAALFSTDKFADFSNRTGIQEDTISNITYYTAYFVGDDRLIQKYYVPLGSKEFYNPKDNTWYNLYGQRIDNVS